MKKLALWLLMASISMGISSATDNSLLNLTYSNHSISFEIPENWEIYKDIQQGNNTKIVLSDGTSAIGVDLVKSQDMGEIVGEYLKYNLAQSEIDRLGVTLDNLSDEKLKLLYKNHQRQLQGALYDYYKDNVINPKTRLGQSGSGISVRQDAAIGTNFGHQNDPNDPIEWILTWTGPEYEYKIVGVHALFIGNYTQKSIEWRGSPYDNLMPEPLWIVLTTINGGDKPLPNPATGSSLADWV